MHRPVTMVYNDFARRSFRDLADQDYIAARVCYRLQLDQHFLWSSLQAVEKYLKAILVFNGQSAKKLGHDLVRALTRVEAIRDLKFKVPDDVVEFIHYLDEYGKDRYLTRPSYVRRYSLLHLDKTVWYIRRYCDYMRGEIRRKGEGEVVDRLEQELRRINRSEYERYPYRFRIFGGYLEKLVANGHPASVHLIWQNLYYGRRPRHRIKFAARDSFTNPTHFVRAASGCWEFSELAKVVDFPRCLRLDFEQRNR